MANAYKLTWTTVINGQKKEAVTHFGTRYTVIKNGNGSWLGYVTVPGHSGLGPQTATLATGVTFAQARKACQDDATKSGGR